MTGFREYTLRSEMERAGWKISSTDSECRNCGAQITWAKSPRQKNVALDAASTTLHFKTCSGNGAETRVNSGQSGALSSSNGTNSTPTANDFMVLRESMDELAQAIRALCGLLRERKAAK